MLNLEPQQLRASTILNNGSFNLKAFGNNEIRVIFNETFASLPCLIIHPIGNPCLR
jgi:hypothetical protein